MQDNNINLDKRLIKFFMRPLIVISFACSFYVFFNTPEVSGTSFFFTLPLTFSFCCLFCSEIIEYQKHGFGLKVFYSVVLVRYLILPVLTCMAGHFAVDGISAFGINGLSSSDGYSYAIWLSNIELIVSCIIIKRYYRKEYVRISRKIDHSRKYYYEDLGIIGFAILLIFLIFILLRGRLSQSIRFFVVSSSIEDDAMYGVDIFLAHITMAFLVIVVTSYFQKRNDKKSSIINVFMPLAISLLTCITVLGNNRMMIVYFALSALIVLLRAFPKYKSFFMSTLVPAMLIVLISFTLIKQFGLDATYSSGKSDIAHNDITVGLSSYVCGIENVAHTYDLYKITGDKVSFMTFLSDIVNHTMPLKLVPGLPVVEYFSSIPTSTELATVAYEMVSVIGQTLFLGGYYGGWLLDIISFIIVIRLLIIFEIHSKLEKKLGNVYIFNWLAVLFGMVMCYCLQTLYHNLTYVPLLVYCLLRVNEFFKMHKTRVKKV